MTNTHPLEPVDINGMLVGVGDSVEILSIPHWLTHDLPLEDQTRLKSLEGKVVSINEIDKLGYLWLSFPHSCFCLQPQEVRRVE
jgi:hypothetical protein